MHPDSAQTDEMRDSLSNSIRSRATKVHSGELTVRHVTELSEIANLKQAMNYITISCALRGYNELSGADRVSTVRNEQRKIRHSRLRSRVTETGFGTVILLLEA